MYKIIDGRKRAEELKKRLLTLVIELKKNTGTIPGLAALRIGDNPSSQLYVKTKGLQAKALGYHFEEHVFPNTASLQDIEYRINELNQAENIHGIILQLPTPDHLDRFHLLSCIDPLKDVDGLHPLNSGKLFQGIKGGFVPCTPLGCLDLIQTVNPSLSGLRVGIIGTSILVGRPMALLLLQQGCTVSIANSKTKDLASFCEAADILIVAIGKPRFIQGDWIKKGATVIDVGINRLANGDLVGDVDFDQALLKAGAITPVPGGVGPMTVVSLLRNTLESAYMHADQPFSL